jgi:D-glycero-D-manno-heptose 1,7-bisphosphate phosphatase
MANKVIFLDRDGVINWDPIGDYIKKKEDFRFLSGVADALKKLNDNGYRIVVISNQAGVGDGVFSEDGLKEVNEKFKEEAKQAGAPIEDIFYCLHGKKAGCSCRKPEIGLFHQAEEAIGKFDKTQTYYVGDKASDIEAGMRYGLKAIFVLTGHGENEQQKLKKEFYPEKILKDLKEAVDYLIGDNL